MFWCLLLALHMMSETILHILAGILYAHVREWDVVVHILWFHILWDEYVVDIHEQFCYLETFPHLWFIEICTKQSNFFLQITTVSRKFGLESVLHKWVCIYSNSFLIWGLPVAVFWGYVSCNVCMQWQVTSIFVGSRPLMQECTIPGASLLWRLNLYSGT